jgi:phage terminase small subunit
MSPKQQKFITEYVVDLNATQAAIRAGYAKRSANREGTRLLSNAVIAREIAARKQAQLDAAELSAARVLEELRRVAFADIRQFFNARGDLKPISQLSPAERASIATIEVVMKNATAGDGKIDRVLKIKLWDKVRALEMAMKHFALLVEKLDVTIHDEELNSRIAAGRQRALERDAVSRVN